MNELELFLSKIFPNKELVNELIAQSEIMEVPDESNILQDEQYIKVVPLVIKGKIKVMKKDESGKEVLLYHIKPGESCAISIAAGLNNHKSPAFAVTGSKTLMLAIPVNKLDEMINRFPYLNKFVLQLFNRRFNELIDFIDAVSFKSVDERLINYLKKNIVSTESGTYIFKTHREIAEELGTAREVISRLLKHLEKDGKLVNHRGKIEILSAL